MHKSVLLNECIDNLNIKEDGVYVDLTLGYGGHSSEILKRIKKGFLFAFDQDEDAVIYSRERLGKISNNFIIITDNFENVDIRLKEHDVVGVDGILFDLGVSSVQIDNKDRGFSYQADARLDMRMSKNNKLTAYDVVNNYTKEELINIFYKYGEERYSVGIASKIIMYREKKKIETTLELVDIIKSGVPSSYIRETNPARRVFQAIRIEVNKELEVLEVALDKAIKLLRPGGRLCVITFHSLEDRIVKNMFKKYSEVIDVFKGLPNIPLEYKPIVKIVNKKVILPSNEEMENNSRSKSAKLRVIERI